MLLLLGCSDSPSNGGETTSPNSVGVFTTAPVVNAVVTDATDQLATYNPLTMRYDFENSIVYPVTVRTNATTFVDVDYDNTPTAADIKPLNVFSTGSLQSFCNEVNYLSDLYYSRNYQDMNVTTQTYKEDINSRFGIDICTSAATDENVAKVLFGAYNYVAADNNLSTIEEIASDVSKVEDFFTQNLSILTVDHLRYYSAFNALVHLDAGRATRVDTIHKPALPSVLREDATLLGSYTNLNVQDIYADTTNVYTASAQDEFARLNIDLTSCTFYGTGNLDGYGLGLFYQLYDTNECLFLANNNDGILPFMIDSSGVVTRHGRIYRYFDATGTEHNLTDQGVVSMSGFVSISQNKRFLGISTKDNGFYLIDAKDNLSGCALATDLNTSAMLIQENNGTNISAVFRDDGSFVYVANAAAGINRYDLSVPTQADINSSKATYTLENSQEAYNLRLFPNSNTLLVTTDKGLQVYDITNDSSLSFIGSYPLEGAQQSYFPDLDLEGNFVVVTDGYKGAKVLKLTSGYIPELCGVAYFAPSNNPEELAKVTSVKYTQEGVLYIGLESNGVLKMRLDDLLFRHCQ